MQSARGRCALYFCQLCRCHCGFNAGKTRCRAFGLMWVGTTAARACARDQRRSQSAATPPGRTQGHLAPLEELAHGTPLELDFALESRARNEQGSASRSSRSPAGQLLVVVRARPRPRRGRTAGATALGRTAETRAPSNGALLLHAGALAKGSIWCLGAAGGAAGRLPAFALRTGCSAVRKLVGRPAALAARIPARRILSAPLAAFGVLADRLGGAGAAVGAVAAGTARGLAAPSKVVAAAMLCAFFPRSCKLVVSGPQEQGLGRHGRAGGAGQDGAGGGARGRCGGPSSHRCDVATAIARVVPNRPV